MSGLWDRTLVYLGLREESEDAYDDVYDDRGEPSVARFDADTDPHAEQAPQRPAERRRAAPVEPAAEAERTPSPGGGRAARPVAGDRRTSRPGESDNGARPVKERDRGTRAPTSAGDRPTPRTRVGSDRARGAAPTGSSRTPTAAAEPIRGAGSDAAAAPEAPRGIGREAAPEPEPSPPVRRDPERSSGPRVTRSASSDVHVLPVTRGVPVHVQIVTITAFDEVEQVGQRVRAGEPVLFDLRDADATTARRVVDFASGIVFGLHGGLDRVGRRAFLVRPRGVELPAEERGRLADLGYRVPAGSEA
jgi:cell division inhibitor SepF